jgi:hypothetical protein
VVAHWLVAHPGVEIITRDRAGAYAEGARQGAPDAIQVADRFHLLQNVREILQRLLERHQDALHAATTKPPPSTDTAEVPLPDTADPPVPPSSAPRPVPEAPSEPPAAADTHVPPVTTVEQASQNRRARRQVRYATVQELIAHGMSMRAIATQLHLSRKTVRQFGTS